MNRSHVILHDLPPAPKRPVLRGISAASLESWRARRFLIDEPAAVISAAETSDVALRVFGSKAPRVRTPESAAEEIEEQEREEEFERLAKVPDEQMKYSGPTYDPTTGTVELGRNADGSKMKWCICDPNSGMMHGIVMGRSQTGKTNHINLIRIGAAHSGLYSVFSADPTGRHASRHIWSKVGYYFEGTDEIVMMLNALERAVRARQQHTGYKQPNQEKPGILTFIEDAHFVFEKSPEAVSAAEFIATHGPNVGIALIITIPDGNVQRFGGSHELRIALAKRSMRAAYGSSDAKGMLRDLTRDIS